jgi:hypothetical protein
MRPGDVMKDSFYAPILLEIENKIHEGDRLAAARGIYLTDSNIRSLLLKASHAAKGKKPKPVPESASAKDKFLAEFLDQLIDLQNSIFVAESPVEGTVDEQPLPVADWIRALACIKDSCGIRTGDEPGSRGYLDFLPGFLAQARRVR